MLLFHFFVAMLSHSKFGSVLLCSPDPITIGRPAVVQDWLPLWRVTRMLGNIRRCAAILCLRHLLGGSAAAVQASMLFWWFAAVLSSHMFTIAALAFGQLLIIGKAAIVQLRLLIWLLAAIASHAMRIMATLHLCHLPLMSTAAVMLGLMACLARGMLSHNSTCSAPVLSFHAVLICFKIFIAGWRIFQLFCQDEAQFKSFLLLLTGCIAWHGPCWGLILSETSCTQNACPKQDIQCTYGMQCLPVPAAVYDHNLPRNICVPSTVQTSIETANSANFHALIALGRRPLAVVDYASMDTSIA